MRKFLLACIVFGLATWTTMIAHAPFLPTGFLFILLSSSILVTIAFIVGLQIPSLKQIFTRSSWLLLFSGTLAIHLIILSTGSLYSPFLILLFLLALIISLLLSFHIAFAFIGFSLFTILMTMNTDPVLMLQLQDDPIKAGIYLLSFLIVLPLFQVLTTRYHLNDNTLRHLSAEVNVEDSLLDEVNELVIVTDPSFHVLSVNDAVEKFLHRSRAEIIDQPMFDIVYLQDTNGSLVTKDMLSADLDPKNAQTPRTFRNLRLITTPIFADSVGLYMKAIPDFEGKIIQILFIISDSHPQSDKTPINDTFMHARIRYDAMTEGLKKQLKTQSSPTSLYQFILITNFQQDLLNTQALEEHGLQEKKTRVDLAKLCKQTLLAEQDFAEAFRVKLRFFLPDFSEKDVSPLVTNVMQVSPEDFTGPFFTTTCDTSYVRLVIQKLLDLATLLAATSPDPVVELHVERKETSSFTVTVIGPSPELTSEELHLIFTKFYGVLNTKTNLNAGSGLEGYLAKTLSEQLHLPLEISHTKNPSLLRWTLRIPK